MASYSRFKTQAMYSKHGSYRLFTFLILSIGFLLFVIYWHRYRLQPIGGTLISLEAENFFKRNYEVGKIIRSMKKNPKDVKWSPVIAGGRKALEFDCSV